MGIDNTVFLGLLIHDADLALPGQNLIQIQGNGRAGVDRVGGFLHLQIGHHGFPRLRHGSGMAPGVFRVKHQVLRRLIHQRLFSHGSLRIQFSAEIILSSDIAENLHRRRSGAHAVCPPVIPVAGINRDILAPFFHLLKELLQSHHAETDLSFIIGIQILQAPGNLGAGRRVVRNHAGDHKGNQIIRIPFFFQIFQKTFNPAGGNFHFLLFGLLGGCLENVAFQTGPVELIVGNVGGSPVGCQKQLISIMVMLPVPYQHPVSAGALPVEGHGLFVEGEHAVMGMHTGIQMTNSMIIQSIRIAPGISVDIGGHGGNHRMADPLPVLSRLFQTGVENITGNQFRHVEIISGKSDFPAAHIFLKIFDIFPGGMGVKILHLPVILALPDKSLIFLPVVLVDIVEDIHRLFDIITMITDNLVLPFRIADIRV